MAYEHGSLDLGIKNPFRFEGAVRALRGGITAVLGLIVLLSVAEATMLHKVAGWITTVIGFILLSNGLLILGSGIMQTLRFFVGRSVPTSLAYNHAKSEADSAVKEENDLAYDAEQIEQMLVGRKNLTFTEPTGLISRLIHTIFPKLTFVPYPIRNMALQLSDTLAQSIIAVCAFALSSFVVATGLLGESARFIQPILSSLFLGYLIIIWFRAGRPISRRVTSATHSRGAAGIARTLVLAITFPIISGVLVNTLITPESSSFSAQLLLPIEEIDNPGSAILVQALTTVGDNVSNLSWIVLTTLLGLLSFAILATLITKRCAQANPVTEVAELRENWQESVHPREIFINLDAMVMANRRYKEVPNRVYRMMKPMLKEQANGKGAFYGETIQETQPEVKPSPFQGLAKRLRIAGTVLGQVLMLACALIAFMQYEVLIDLLNMLWFNRPNVGNDRAAGLALVAELSVFFATILNAVIGLLIFGVFGRLLTNLTHVFWSEFLFESYLIYFKCEGTFTESTLSTGKSIYDSTQSENIIVRSSMTPWVIVSKAVSSTFAGVGSQNLKQPRHLLELHSEEQEMTSIVNDLRGYLASRQTIASLNTEADLKAAAQINKLNVQSREIPLQPTPNHQGAIAASHDKQLTYEEE